MPVSSSISLHGHARARRPRGSRRAGPQLGPRVLAPGSLLLGVERSPVVACRRRLEAAARRSPGSACAFCSASLKVRPMAMASPTDFICVPRVASAPGNFSKAKRGILVDHVVDGRLEAGRRLAGDVVGDLVERVADGQLGGDLGDGEAGGLGGQRRASARRAGSSR